MSRDEGMTPEEQCPIDCGDNSCFCAGPKIGGMRTNGGCRCDERSLRRAVFWWRRYWERHAVQARAEALEEAARLVWNHPASNEYGSPCAELAMKIRALAEQPPPKEQEP